MQLQILSIKRRIAMAVASVAVSYIIKRYILKTGKKRVPEYESSSSKRYTLPLLAVLY
jgi:hypothetical protein